MLKAIARVTGAANLPLHTVKKSAFSNLVFKLCFGSVGGVKEGQVYILARPERQGDGLGRGREEIRVSWSSHVEQRLQGLHFCVVVQQAAVRDSLVS